jgi:SAM-dependent methyltransferase
MSAPSNWWQTFFQGIALDLWRQAVTEDQTRAEVDFLEKVLAVPAGGRILDVPCGGGRHALGLAARGYRVTGVDIAAENIAEARAKTAERGLSVAWEQRDMRDLPWSAEFDGAYCFGNSFGYLDDAGNAAFLHAVAAAVKPGARFLLDTGVVAEVALPHFQERGWYPVGDILFLVQNRYDHVRGGLETEYIFIRDGKVERRRGWQRVYTFSELSRLLADAGFTDVQGYGSLEREPFRLGSPRLLLLATRKVHI